MRLGGRDVACNASHPPCSAGEPPTRLVAPDIGPFPSAHHGGGCWSRALLTVNQPASTVQATSPRRRTRSAHASRPSTNTPRPAAARRTPRRQQRLRAFHRGVRIRRGKLLIRRRTKIRHKRLGKWTRAERRGSRRPQNVHFSSPPGVPNRLLTDGPRLSRNAGLRTQIQEGIWLAA